MIHVHLLKYVRFTNREKLYETITGDMDSDAHFLFAIKHIILFSQQNCFFFSPQGNASNIKAAEAIPMLFC